WLGSKRPCRCTPEQVARYQGRLSGPLLDRIDLHVEVPALTPEDLLDAPAGEATAAMQARCISARERQVQRQGKSNQALQGQEIDRHVMLTGKALAFLRQAAGRLGWSARSTHRTLKVARTIADLSGALAVETAHIAEAVQYRRGMPALR
ncbi:MAG: hypothetical protein JWP41_4180, partial [Ramlibacter sp.]|nr:hypothetical protein [Ramlibacter sp.]